MSSILFFIAAIGVIAGAWRATPRSRSATNRSRSIANRADGTPAR